MNEEQIALFDDVLGHFVERIETRALAELSNRLAPIGNAPPELIRSLAQNAEVTVAGPVLSTSTQLSTSDLVEIAKTHGQGHLLAISSRPELEERLTDILLTRGDADVLHRVATNGGSKISSDGFATLLVAAQTDERLSEATGMRRDLPPHLLRQLLMRASEAVRQKLVANVSAHSSEEIGKVLSEVTTSLRGEIARPRTNLSAAHFVELLHKNNELDAAALGEFARNRKYNETVAALSLLSQASTEIIQALMHSPRPEGLLIPCRAAELDWNTVQEIFDCRPIATVSNLDIAKLRAEFEALTPESAKRTLRFWKVRETSARSG